MLTTAFRATAFVLGCATVTALILALTARNDAREGTQPHFLAFVMWSFFFMCGVCSLSCLGVAEYVRRSGIPTPARSTSEARV